MTTYVNNKTGHLYRKIDPVGVTSDTKKYFEKGMVALRGYGERTEIILSTAELEEHYTLLTEDDEDD